MEQPIREKGVYVFGRYRLDPDRRTLLRDGTPVELTPRLFDALAYLVENHDRLVERDELERAVWRDRSVVVSNLGKAISALRKALQAEGADDSLIVTVPGRGFRFGTVVVFEPAQPELTAPSAGVAALPAGGASKTPRLWVGVGLRFLWPLLVLAAGALALRTMQTPAERKPPPVSAPFDPPPHSVAVMAFTNLSGDPSQTYFSDGLSEELIDSLSRIGTLHVAARRSAFSFRDKPATIQDIARALDVGTVLDGSVRRDGARLRVTAQLIDGRTGYGLWSHSYDREAGDIFQVQGELAQAVAASLQVNIVGPDAARLRLGGTSKPKALDAYLRAMAMTETPDDTLAKAKQIMAAFDDAVTLDPNFAVAQAQRAIALWHIASSDADPDLAANRRMKDDALATARRAVALAPDLAVAHMALGMALDDALPDFSRQEAEFARARDLAPGSSEIDRYYGHFEVLAGHTARGVDVAEQAAALDPLTPQTYYLLAGTLYLAGRGDDALAALQHARDLGAPDSVYAATLAGFIALMRGDAAGARAACAGKSDWQIDLCLAMADHALGDQKAANADFARLRSTLGDTGAYNYAQVYAQWGRLDDALHWLEAAYNLRDSGLIQLKADPLLDPVRKSPRFKAIETRVGFPS